MNVLRRPGGMSEAPARYCDVLEAEVARLKRANEDGLRDGLEARADAEVAQQQLRGAVELLRRVYSHADAHQPIPADLADEVERALTAAGGQ